MKNIIIETLLFLIIFSSFVFIPIVSKADEIGIDGRPKDLIELLLINPENKHTGFDVKNSTVVTGIPNSYYFISSNDQGGIGNVEIKSLTVETPLRGKYILNILGNGTGLYEVLISISNGLHNCRTIKGIIAKDEVYKFNIILSESVSNYVLKKEIIIAANNIVKDDKLSSELIYQIEYLSKQTKATRDKFNILLNILENAKIKYQPQLNDPMLEFIDDIIKRNGEKQSKTMDLIVNEFIQNNYVPIVYSNILNDLNETMNESSIGSDAFGKWVNEATFKLNSLEKNMEYYKTSSYNNFRIKDATGIINLISKIIKEKKGNQKQEKILNIIKGLIEKEIRNKKYKSFPPNLYNTFKQILKKDQDLKTIKNQLKMVKTMHESETYKAINILIDETNRYLETINK